VFVDFAASGTDMSVEFSLCCFDRGASDSRSMRGFGSVIIGPANCFSQAREYVFPAYLEERVEIEEEECNPTKFGCTSCVSELKVCVEPSDSATEGEPVEKEDEVEVKKIVGGTIGGILALIAVVVGFWLYFRKRSSVEPEPPVPEPESREEGVDEDPFELDE
jgi:hypothetical protein